MAQTSSLLYMESLDRPPEVLGAAALVLMDELGRRRP